MLSRLYRTLTVSIQLILDESGLSVNTDTCFFINLYFFFASAEKIGSPDEKRKNQQYGKGDNNFLDVNFSTLKHYSQGCDDFILSPANVKG